MKILSYPLAKYYVVSFYVSDKMFVLYLVVEVLSNIQK